MAYINPAAGVSGAQVTLTVYHTTKVADATGLVVPALQDVTINNANDVFTWTQLDTGSKLQTATTATNSIAMNLVLDPTTFFPGASPTTTAASQGVFGLSKNKTKVQFELVMGDTDGGANTKTIGGFGYITGLAPTVSADSPVWVSPVTITVTGDFTVATTA
jgi:hypothetical protein